MIIQVYSPISNAEEAEVEWFYENLQYLQELTPKKRCPFHYRVLECKSRKSRNTWSVTVFVDRDLGTGPNKKKDAGDPSLE